MAIPRPPVRRKPAPRPLQAVLPLLWLWRGVRLVSPGQAVSSGALLLVRGRDWGEHAATRMETWRALEALYAQGERWQRAAGGG